MAKGSPRHAFSMMTRAADEDALSAVLAQLTGWAAASAHAATVSRAELKDGLLHLDGVNAAPVVCHPGRPNRGVGSRVQ